MNASEPTRRKTKRRDPKKATPAYLEKSALHYLDRYSASSAHLRHLLMAKVNRAARFHGSDPAEGAAAIDALIARLIAKGLLDDARYAQARARSFWRRGASVQGIRAKLAAKGVPAALIDGALEALREEAAHPELAAALAYARRRRYGPYGAQPVSTLSRLQANGIAPPDRVWAQP